MLSEQQVIQKLTQACPSHIGDDAAVLNSTPSIVISKDILNEDVHFRLRYFTPDALAHKALHINLSDIAAMGATPKYVLLGLGIPKHFEDKVEAFLNAFTEACHKANVILIGGDTTQAKALTLSVTAIGETDPKQIKHRHTAKAGDMLCVTGNLGLAYQGLQALEQNTPANKEAIEACLTPTARIKEGIWLGGQASVHAMMDISDGLYLDVKKLCEASSLGAKIDVDNFDDITAALTGGEDYELLFTVDKQHVQALKQAFDAQFTCKMNCIGEIQKDENICFLLDGKPFVPKIKPFLHFGELPF